MQEARDGRVVVYMGDDEQFEYIYRYVSNQPWKRAQRQGIDPLDDGVLYVAKFHADGTGRVAAADARQPGPCRMDAQRHPDQHPRGRRHRRGDADGPARVDRHVPAALDGDRHADQQHRPRCGRDQPAHGAAEPGSRRRQPAVTNPYGHIIRWGYEHDFDEPTFYWDIFALAGDPAVPATGSTIVGDKYGSPDGLYVAPSGRLWIQTDVSGSTINSGAYAGFGNNQMLCADPTTKETRASWSARTSARSPASS